MRSEEVNVGGGEMSSRLLDSVLRPDPDPGMESLDYEVVESAAARRREAEVGSRQFDHMGYVTMKWLFALLVGIGTASISFFINVVVEHLAGFKFRVTLFLLRFSSLIAFLFYAAANTALVCSSAVIVSGYAPAAAGSGIPEIKGYLNGIDSPGLLLVRTLVGKIFGSIGSVAGGLALGKEGPLVHIGACLASLLGQGGSAHHRLSGRWVAAFQNDRDRRDLVTCGAAAGAAAAFRAPVGGVLFAMEEATSWWRPTLTWRVFFTSAVVSVVLRALMRGGGGEGFIIWDVHGGQADYTAFELLPMAMLGVAGGLAGALFNRLSLTVSLWRRTSLHPRGARVKVYDACVVALITSTLSFGLPLLHNCTPCPALARPAPAAAMSNGNYVNFLCGPHEYNDLATLLFNTQDDAIRNLFSSKTLHEYSVYTLLLFLVAFFGLAVVTYGTVVPAGQFVPGIMIGATYGRLVGILMAQLGAGDQTDEGTYALLGAASFLGGSMRMTVSLCVIMVEITNNLNMLPPIMLVLLISKAVGDGLTPAFYDMHAHLRSLPILPPNPQRSMRGRTARDAAGGGVVTLPRVGRVDHIAAVLKGTTHNGFPVEEEGLFLGLILRSQVVALLRSKAAFQLTPEAAPPPSGQADAAEFAKPVSVKGVGMEEVELSTPELAMWLDLGPFLNPSPYVVEEDMSLAKVHLLFRSLGLRHLCVVPKVPRVTGIITRKDLLPDVLQERQLSRLGNATSLQQEEAADTDSPQGVAASC